MSKSFASFIRIAGTLIGGLNIFASIMTLKFTYNIGFWDILSFLLSVFSAVLVLLCAWTFASLIERSLDQGQAQVKQDERLARIEAALGLKTPTASEPASQQKAGTSGIKTSKPISTPDDPNYVICPCCKEKQKRGQRRCKTCGYFFE
jgi:hypothetical protein